MFVIGIPHGALDHLTESLIKSQKITLKFIIIYIAMMVPIFLLWYWNPTLALIFFVFYSAWHFGQTELNLGNKKSNFWIFMGKFNIYILVCLSL